MGLFNGNQPDGKDDNNDTSWMPLPSDTSLWDFHGWEPIDFSKTDEEE